ncbi:MAG: substrate-binding domain-containing protein [Planctomycetaceae bacterium]|nr:substrate-binding domain-containing protein [Planctomycetaceae bacterium]
MRQTRPTLKMIADFAGVSRGTVDRVLHGRPRVSPEKRKRVEEALEKLHYTPNAAARSLALKTQNVTIAVITPSWGAYFRREIDKGIAAAQETLRDYGLSVVKHPYETDSPADCVGVIDRVLEEGARGLAVCASNSSLVRKRLVEVSRSGVPVVTFNSDLPDCGQLCFVGQDDRKSGRIAAELMVKLVGRHTNICLACNNREFDSIQSRLEGFIARAAELGLSQGEFPILETYDRYDITYRKVLEFWKDNPDYGGLYMVAESTVGAVAALKEAGRLESVRIVSHDLPETTAEALRDGSVDFTVDQNIYFQGFRPVSIIADYLLSGKCPDQRQEYTPSTILCAESIRESEAR